jgi:hypothetical protein
MRYFNYLFVLILFCIASSSGWGQGHMVVGPFLSNGQNGSVIHAPLVRDCYGDNNSRWITVSNDGKGYYRNCIKIDNAGNVLNKYYIKTQLEYHSTKITDFFESDNSKLFLVGLAYGDTMINNKTIGLPNKIGLIRKNIAYQGNDNDYWLYDYPFYDEVINPERIDTVLPVKMFDYGLYITIAFMDNIFTVFKDNPEQIIWRTKIPFFIQDIIKTDNGLRAVGGAEYTGQGNIKLCELIYNNDGSFSPNLQYILPDELNFSNNTNDLMHLSENCLAYNQTIVKFENGTGYVENAVILNPVNSNYYYHNIEDVQNINNKIYFIGKSNNIFNNNNAVYKVGIDASNLQGIYTSSIINGNINPSELDSKIPSFVGSMNNSTSVFIENGIFNNMPTCIIDEIELMPIGLRSKSKKEDFNFNNGDIVFDRVGIRCGGNYSTLQTIIYSNCAFIGNAKTVNEMTPIINSSNYNINNSVLTFSNSVKKAEVAVYNLSGEELDKTTISGGDLDLKFLGTGVYMMRIQCDDQAEQREKILIY